MPVSKICIVGLNDFGLLSGRMQKLPVRGETVQRVLLARAWRDLGIDVSVIVHDSGQGARVEGITAIAAHGRDEGVPLLRTLHPRATRMLAALMTADADVYFQSRAGAYTGITSWFCRSTEKRFVYRVASDLDCVPRQQHIEFWQDRKLFEYGLRRADLVAAQTSHQVALLLEHYCVASSLINLAVEIPPHDCTAPKDIDVLWVSNLQPAKRPELLLELARRMPQVQFTLAGGPTREYQTYYDDVLEAAARLRNVSILGPVSFGDIGTYFDRARVLVDTSSLQGFPNTFLQAWARRVPVVSFLDPDGLIQMRELGWAANSVDDMREAIVNLLADEPRRRAMGDRAREFVRSECAPDAVARRYLDLLKAREQPRLRFGTTG
jgi:glycosyltransferase involved in cell wall biosynthesis